jgi:type II secretory pathway pseudopilin PulG
MLAAFPPKTYMRNNLPPGVVRRRGMSLLELTIVILVLLGLVCITFIGARGWKNGSDRASCILTLRDMQMAMRSYQNLYGHDPGDRLDEGSEDIARHLYEKGYICKRLFDQAAGDATCPSGGTYRCDLPDTFPAPGELYMKCSFSAIESHAPSAHGNW